MQRDKIISIFPYGQITYKNKIAYPIKVIKDLELKYEYAFFLHRDNIFIMIFVLESNPSMIIYFFVTPEDLGGKKII